MPKFSLGVGDEDYHEERAVLKNEDFIEEGQDTVVAQDTTIVNVSDDPEVPSKILEIGEDAPSRLTQAQELGVLIDKLEEAGSVSQVSIESAYALVKPGTLLPIQCYTEHPSQVHFEETLRRLRYSLKMN